MNRRFNCGSWSACFQSVPRSWSFWRSWPYEDVRVECLHRRERGCLGGPQPVQRGHRNRCPAGHDRPATSGLTDGHGAKIRTGAIFPQWQMIALHGSNVGTSARRQPTRHRARDPRIPRSTAIDGSRSSPTSRAMQDGRSNPSATHPEGDGTPFSVQLWAWVVGWLCDRDASTERVASSFLSNAWGLRNEISMPKLLAVRNI